ncbi:MAG: hypothetical protein C4521_07495 [Actinobacteria bacterium]|nr:MAG: hypothetical protein C4521_07495 [Actinomycetota bacterium]
MVADMDIEEKDDKLVEDPAEKMPDTIEVPEPDKVTFSDKPDGTPEPPQEEAKAEPAEKPKRNRKDYQERINQLVRSAHEAEERAAAAEAKALLLDEQLKTIREQYGKTVNETQTKAEQELIERKKKAIDEGDMSAYDEASEALLQLRLQRNAQTPERAPDQAKAAEQPAFHPAAKAWMDRNAWFLAQENKHLARTVAKIEAKLVAPKDKGGAGLEYGDELYRKIDEELAKLPEFDDVRGVIEDEPEPERPKTVVSPPSRGGEPPPKPKTGSLTRYDIQTMRTFGLDPNNVKHRSAYLARKSGASS